MPTLLAKPTPTRLLATLLERGPERVLALTSVLMWGEWMWGANEVFGAAYTVQGIRLRATPTPHRLIATTQE